MPAARSLLRSLHSIMHWITYINFYPFALLSLLWTCHIHKLQHLFHQNFAFLPTEWALLPFLSCHCWEQAQLTRSSFLSKLIREPKRLNWLNSYSLFKPVFRSDSHIHYFSKWRKKCLEFQFTRLEKRGKKPTNEIKLTNKIKNKLSKRTLLNSFILFVLSAAIDFFSLYIQGIYNINV